MTERMMLINGRHAEELRVAVVEDRVLQLYDVEGAEATQKRGNIYRGVVSNIEPSLNAAFVDFGDAKKGFLTRHDVVAQAFHRKVDDPRGASIDQVLQKGQSVTVQVTRDAEAQKGATLTTNLSIAGRYLVFLPFDEQRGVSRKVEDEALRRKLRDKGKGLEIGAGAGFIIRTNGAEQTKTELKADLEGLTRLWKMVVDEAQRGRGPKLLYNDQDLLIHALRDYLDSSISEVWIDDAALHGEAERYMQATMPQASVALKRYDERTPVFSRFNLEPQIAGIYRRVVPLASGGSIVIDPTEALTAVDVNSGKARQGGNQAETAYQTNLEAAAEVARQLRLRDIGGLLVVDFIDMRARQHQRAVEKALTEAMKLDRARHSVSRISANGLVEINRQRIRRALQLRTHRECPTCQGVGRLIAPELASLSLIRRIEARAATGRLFKARVALHPELADFTQNRRRGELAELERAYDIIVEVVGDRRVEPSGERIDWQHREEVKAVSSPSGRGASSARQQSETNTDSQSTKTPQRSKKEGPEATSVNSATLIEKNGAREGDEEEPQSRRPRRKRRRRRRGPTGGE
ncbi:MAG: Rne/Rng family ribonuclease, partial [Deltaproteobacteria bacterium]|nr:Rne/Rng family ribonuclease [Deltaproteobacteria bacterium]